MSEQFQNTIDKSKKEANGQKHDHRFSCLGTGTSLKNCGIKLISFIGPNLIQVFFTYDYI